MPRGSKRALARALPEDDFAAAKLAGAEGGGVSLEELDRIAALPGVYIMRGADGKILYIGKAANLSARVKSYFKKSGDARFNVAHLLRHVQRVETIITANEKEAFLLENTLIKREQPRYNIRLRDDKTYVSVKIDKRQQWPRAIVTRRRNERDGALYLGPYASAHDVRETLRLLQRVFPIRSCPDSVLKNRARPCLLHPIGRCCAPCVLPVDRAEYMELVENTIDVLKGRTGDVVAKLREQMRRSSEAMEYEKAAATRDRIRAIEATTERQGVHVHDGEDRDAIVMERAGGRAAFAVFVYRNGLLTSSRPFILRDPEREPEEMIEEFLARYYEIEAPPREVLVEIPPPNPELIENWLSERRGAKCEILAPQRGEKLRLIEIAKENCRLLLEQHLSGQKSLEETYGEIAEKFQLEAPPDPMECYDISTIQGFATVGSLVTFRQGEPDKSRYRRFRIKSFSGQDDFGALREVLSRRFRRAVESDEALPGLVVIDGGKGQLNVAVAVLNELGLSALPVVSIAKSKLKKRGETKERTEERFFLPGRKNPVKFASNSPALYLLQRLRDEAHRFGITFHRELRARRNFRSSLEDLAGVGKGRARSLLRAFGSLRALREATLEQIEAAPGIPAPVARAVFDFLHSQPPTDAELEDQGSGGGPSNSPGGAGEPFSTR